MQRPILALLAIGFLVAMYTHIQARPTRLALLMDDQRRAPRFNPIRVIDEILPPILAPRFVPAERAGDAVLDNELVLGVVIGSEARAYPINQLTGPHREIINDRLGGQAIAATW